MGKKDDSPEARRDIEGQKQVLTSMNCGRHDAFFQLGKTLARNYRYPMYEVEWELFEVAASDRTMKKKARDIIKSLKKPRHRRIRYYPEGKRR